MLGLFTDSGNDNATFHLYVEGTEGPSAMVPDGWLQVDKTDSDFPIALYPSMYQLNYLKQFDLAIAFQVVNTF